MVQKALLLGLLAIGTFITVFTVIVLATAQPEVNSSPTSKLETCKTLVTNGPNKINLLFFGSQEEVNRYTNYLFEISPFKEHQSDFNVFFIDDYNSNEVCTLYRGIAVLCYSKELLQKAASCPHHFVIVLTEQETSIRSSAYREVVSLNTNHPLSVLQHEVGHLYNLAEEYVPARLPVHQLNCKSSCEEFETPHEGCYEGCSESSFFRSIDEGVMRTLDSREYGQYNTYHINEQINTNLHSTSLVGNVINDNQDCTSQQSLLLEVELTTEGYKVRNQENINGCAMSSWDDTTQRQFQIGDNMISYQSSLRGNELFTDGLGEASIDGEIFEEKTFWLSIPVQEESSTITFYDENGEEQGSATLGEDSRACKLP